LEKRLGTGTGVSYCAVAVVLARMKGNECVFSLNKTPPDPSNSGIC